MIEGTQKNDNSSVSDKLIQEEQTKRLYNSDTTAITNAKTQKSNDTQQI